MGLDWQPLEKPQPGHEAEFAALYETICDDVGDSALWKRLRAIAISPYETLGAPHVGSDAQADRWAEELYAQRPLKKRLVSRAKFMRTFQGYYVLDLLPPNDGMPAYSNGGPGSYCDLFSFRAKFLEDCQDVIGEELLGEAWMHHRAAELLDYGGRLRARAATYAGEHGVTAVLDRRDVPEEADLDHPILRAHITDSAARWCLFWGERGHGMIADF